MPGNLLFCPSIKLQSLFIPYSRISLNCGRLTKQMNARQSEQVAVENELRIHFREAELTVE